MPLSQSLSRGMALGLRVGELKTRREQEEREEERRKSEEERRKAEEARSKERFEWEQLDRKKRENFEKGDRILRMARQRMEQGDEKGAAAFYNEAYKYWPDGNEAMVILPQSQPDTFQKLLQTGQVQPEFANANVLVISKNHGVIPMDSLQELDKMLGAAFDQNAYLGQLKQRQQALAAKNEEANLNPLQAENGTWMRKTYDLDPSGIIRFKGYAKHEGPIPMSEKHKALRALGLDPYALSDEQKQILAGLTTKAPSAAEQKIKLAEEERKKRGEQRAETELGLKVEKAKREATGLLKPKERAGLYTKAEKAYREIFTDSFGKPAKDAPNKEQWIQDYMNKALGTVPKASPGGAGAGRGGKEVVQEFIDPKTRNRRVVLADGTQQIISPEGNVIAERKPPRGLQRR